MLGQAHQAGSLLATNIDAFTLKDLPYFPHAIESVIISVHLPNMLQKGLPSRTARALKPQALDCR